MYSSRRDFIRTTGYLTIGFYLGSHVSACDPPPRQELPGSLRENPRINAWLEIMADGRVRVLTGKIELGQGIRTAVAQVAAEELDLKMSQVDVLIAETGRTPDEGYTAGSNSIEASAMAIRYAAAAARQKLLALAAQKMNVPQTDLVFTQGKIIQKKGSRSISLSELLDGQQLTDEVRLPVDLKAKDKYRLVGKAVPREDTERIVRAEPFYVHDLDFPGMVHARVVRPPLYGAQLLHCDEQAVSKKLPGLLKIMVNGSFLAVIATNEYQAIQAQKLLRENSQWSAGPPLPKLTPGQLPAWIRSLPVRSEQVNQKGNMSQLANARTAIKADYFKPYIMHGAIGPSCAVALYENNRLDVWTHSQGVYPLRETLSAFLGMPSGNIHVKGVPGSGCYGHNGADDAAAEAALIAFAWPGKHVRVQWSREDEHMWEPYGSAMIMDVEALLDGSGKISHWKYALWSDTHGARPAGRAENLLPARYLKKPFTGRPAGFSGGAHRNAEPYYSFPNQQVDSHFFDGPLRTSSLRSLGAYANIFAIESFMDELATAAGKDPSEFRLLHLEDKRAWDVILRLREITSTSSTAASGMKVGMGMAFSRYKNSGAYCAVAARVLVNSGSRDVRVQKMWAVIDAGEIINADGIRNQVEGGMIQSASWTLMEQVKFEDKQIISRDWVSYPVLSIDRAPEVEVFVIDRPEEAALGAGEAVQGPAAAAIVNAIFHACGKRIRNLPVMDSMV
jgi:CO/xanthine dehydrogenase Mo-binding subunit